MKALATLVWYASGIPGGISAPTLAIGAGIGGQVHAWLSLAPAGTVVILSMAAYFAGVVQAQLYRSLATRFTQPFSAGTSA